MKIMIASPGVPTTGLLFKDKLHVALIVVIAAISYSLFLPSLIYNFDEGIYLWQASRIWHGQVPLRDFFHHQPPLYIYALSPLTLFGDSAYIAARGLSLLAMLICGVAVFACCAQLYELAIAKRLLIIFFCLPLQTESLFAMPNAPMLACAYGALTLLIFGHCPARFLICGLLLGLAVYFKPLALPFVLVAVAYTLAVAQHRAFVHLTGAGIVVAILGYGLFDGLSDGGFRDLLAIQNERLTNTQVIERLKIYPPLAKEVFRRGVASDIQWNIYEHLASFFPLFSPMQMLTPIVVILAISGALLGPIMWSGSRRAIILLQIAALITALLFSIFLWRPVWRHYMLQYLPMLVVLAGAVLTLVVTGRAARWFFDAFLLIATLLIFVNLSTTSGSYQQLRSLNLNGQALLTFDPFVNLLTQSQPACGVSDPLNEFGEASLLAISTPGKLAKFRISSQSVVACMQQSLTPVLLSKWSRWFMTPDIVAMLQTLPEDRFVIRGFWEPTP